MATSSADLRSIEAVTDIATIYQFWSYFLSKPLSSPLPGSHAHSPQQQWQSLLHFSYDGMEREVPLKVHRRRRAPSTLSTTSISPPSASSATFRSTLSEYFTDTDQKAAVELESLIAVSTSSTFFSYSIQANSPEDLAQSLARRYAAVHLLLRRVTHTSNPTDAFVLDDVIRAPSPVDELIGAAAFRGTVDGEGMGDVVMLASATVSLLDLAISDASRFYVNIFANVSNEASANTSFLADIKPLPPGSGASRSHTQLRGQLSLALRMDEEREVCVRNRHLSLRGNLPAATAYQLRYGWCANEALSLGTRQKREQASRSHETSPSRPSDHVSTESLLSSVAQPLVAFEEDQMTALQLTCSRAALLKQHMYFEVLVSVNGRASNSTAGAGVDTRAEMCVAARGEMGLERCLVAAHRDSEIETAFTVLCESNNNSNSSAASAAALSCEVEGVICLSNIPTVRYTLKDAAAVLLQEKARQKETGEKVSKGYRSPELTSLEFNLLMGNAACASFDAADTEEEKDVSRTARPTEVMEARGSLVEDCSTASTSCDDERLVVQSPSLPNDGEHLALSQASSSALCFTASPFPLRTLPHASKTAAVTKVPEGMSGLNEDTLAFQQQRASMITEVDADDDGNDGGSISNHECSSSDSTGTEDRCVSPPAVHLADAPNAQRASFGTPFADNCPHPPPRYTEISESLNALKISGASCAFVTTPNVGLVGCSCEEPSGSLPPRSTPHAPSALPLKDTNSLEALFPSLTSRYPCSSKDSFDMVIQHLVSGGHMREYAERYALSRPASQDGSAVVEGGSASRECALYDPAPHSWVVSRGKNVGGIPHSNSPSPWPYYAVGGSNRAQKQELITAEKNTQGGSGAYGVRENNSDVGSTKRSLSSREAATAQSPPPFSPSRPAPSFVANTDDLQTQQQFRSLATRGDSPLSKGASYTGSAVRPESKCTAQEITCPTQSTWADSAHTHQCAVNENGLQFSESPLPVHPQSLNAKLVPAFIRLGDDINNNHLNNGGAMSPQLQSTFATPVSTPATSVANHHSSFTGKVPAPRSLASVQFMPLAPQPTLLPSEPETPSLHLSNLGELPDPSAMETLQKRAVDLRLSAHYHMLFDLYKQKMVRVRAAEACADAATSNLRAAQARLVNYAADLAGEANNDAAPAKTIVEWLEHVRAKEEAALCVMTELRQRKRALRQRLKDQQTVHRTAQVQLRSRDEALASAEKELQHLLSRIVTEREEVAALTPPMLSRCISSSLMCNASAAVDPAAAAAAQRQDTLGARAQLYRRVADGLNGPVGPVVEPCNAGAARRHGSSAATSPAGCEGEGPTWLASPPSAEKPRSNAASAFSPTPRKPELQDGGRSTALCSSEVFSTARVAEARSPSPPDPNQAGGARFCRAFSNGESKPTHTTPVTPAAAQNSSFQRPLRYSYGTASLSPSATRPAGYETAKSAATQYATDASLLSPRDSSDECPASSLSRLAQDTLLDGIDKGDRALVTHLLRTKQMLFFANNNLLHVACAAALPDVAIVEMLLRVRPELAQGIDANTGNSVLHAACAARYPNEEIVKQLILNGAPVQARNHMGLSAFHVAVLNRADLPRNRIKDMLLTLADCDVNERTRDGRTALHLACESDANLDIVRYLLARGADTQAQALVSFSLDGEEVLLTPLQLSRACHADQVAQSIQGEAGHSALQEAAVTKQ
ncbi:hypothetical protein ABL78_1041 [Leptomonas seymouri]|uniref:Uncharacterized protein n=1 Tax=Leptomonas seymouri TaxID=5684 RepID=A0A0N1IB77_LEPSE|nr:hypothetical protein ABL78_1041 [Leptomonas seymouri]|eukprot:KPI89872.1 hypothetical protein ABL78_1041 [Leptomonas seymouri]